MSARGVGSQSMTRKKKSEMENGSRSRSDNVDERTHLGLLPRLLKVIECLLACYNLPEDMSVRSRLAG